MSLSDFTTSSTTQVTPDHSSPTPRRGIPTWLLPIGLLLGFAAVFLLLFGKRFLPALPVRVAPVITVRAQSSSETAPPITTAPSTEAENDVAGTSTLLFQASGWVEPDPYVIEVPVLVSGIIEGVNVLEGETVEQGEVLATLVKDDALLGYEEATQNAKTMQAKIDAHCHQIPLIGARLAGLKEGVAVENARLQELEDQYDRLKSLSAGSTSRQQLRAAELKTIAQNAAVAKAKSEILEADAELAIVSLEREAMESQLSEAKIKQARAKLALDRHTIRAPMDGIVLNLHAAPGKKRMIDMDDPKSALIVELFEPQKLQARIDVPLNEASLIAVGQPVEMTTDLLPNVTLKGQVTRITGQADLQRNTLQVKVTIAKPDPRLRPEMLVRGKFYAPAQTIADGSSGDSNSATTSGRLAIFMPEAGLTNDQSAWVATSEGTAAKRALKIGNKRREGHIEVTEGLRSGEQIILPPHNQLTPGMRIRIEP